MLAVANIFFFIFHTLLILFNVLGWMWRPTRIWSLGTLLLTLFSWTVMGIWKGAGYCICTDWHWQVRAAMGIHDNADSYIVLLVQKLSGWTPPISLANTVAMWVYIVSFLGSLVTNIIDFRNRRHRNDARRTSGTTIQ
jgi:hypothetical protein